MSTEHISDHDLERYYLGMVVDESELATIEEHLLECPNCVALAEASDESIDLIRESLIRGNYDL